MLAPYAPLLHAMKCSDYSSMCLNVKWKEIWGDNEKLPNHLDLFRSMKSVYPWSLWQCFSVCIDSHFLSPCSSLRVSDAGAEHSTVPRSASKGGNQWRKYCCRLTHFYLALNESALILLWSQFAAFGIAWLHIQPGGISFHQGFLTKDPFNWGLYFAYMHRCPLLLYKE